MKLEDIAIIGGVVFLLTRAGILNLKEFFDKLKINVSPGEFTGNTFAWPFSITYGKKVYAVKEQLFALWDPNNEFVLGSPVPPIVFDAGDYVGQLTGEKQAGSSRSFVEITNPAISATAFYYPVDLIRE